MAGYALILLGLVILLIIGMALSGKQNARYGRFTMGILIYLFMVPIVLRFSKVGANKRIRQAHFMLAVACRAENNRYYLKRGVEVRPGYLGSWIEFNVLSSRQKASIMRTMLERSER